MELIKRTFAAGTTDDEFKLFVQTTQRLGLDVFARQAFCVKRYDSQKRCEVAQTQVSIDGFRVIAERTNAYEGQTAPQWCGDDGAWRDVWLDAKPPAAARVGVYRKGHREPMIGIARYASFVQTKREGGPNRMWGTMPDIMLAKCAEAQALRRAFPQDLSGIYTPDEMGQAENDAEAQPISAPLATYAHGPEEKARSQKQNAGKPTIDEAKAIADGWINTFRTLVHVDEVVEWLPGIIGAWDVSDKRHRGRVYKACLAHVEAGIVEGMSDIGFKEAWGHYLDIARGTIAAPKEAPRAVGAMRPEDAGGARGHGDDQEGYAQ